MLHRVDARVGGVTAIPQGDNCRRDKANEEAAKVRVVLDAAIKVVEQGLVSRVACNARALRERRGEVARAPVVAVFVGCSAGEGHGRASR